MAHLRILGALFFLPALNAFGIHQHSQAEDALLDEWIREQMQDRQEVS